MSDVRKWLEAIGLGQDADAFQSNDIDMELLRKVDDQTLKDIGMSSAGHRLRVRSAIAELSPSGALRSSAGGSSNTTGDSRATAERRQLTVMFCDLVGSTALPGKLDPEEMRDVIRTYQDACSGPVGRYDGFIAKVMGDGILAYFGFPRAHEDDAERAVRAGLDRRLPHVRLRLFIVSFDEDIPDTVDVLERLGDRPQQPFVAIDAGAQQRLAGRERKAVSTPNAGPDMGIFPIRRRQRRLGPSPY
jgi:hypothetical protein